MPFDWDMAKSSGAAVKRIKKTIVNPTEMETIRLAPFIGTRRGMPRTNQTARAIDAMLTSTPTQAAWRNGT